MLIGEIAVFAGLFSYGADAAFTLNEDFSDSLNEEFKAISLLSNNNTCPLPSMIDMQDLMSDLLSTTAKQIQSEPGFKIPFTVNCSVLFNQKIEQISCETEFSNVEEISHASKDELSPSELHLVRKWNILRTSITVGLPPLEHPRAEYWLYFKLPATHSQSEELSLSLINTNTSSMTNTLDQSETKELLSTKSDSLATTQTPSQSNSLTRTISVKEIAGGVVWSGSVYADSTSQANRYIISGSGSTAIVLDTLTNLQWEQTVGGTSVTWSAISAAGSAQSYCASVTKGGFIDWRVPTIVELQSLVDYTISKTTTINTVAFPSNPTGTFWTSLVYKPSTSSSWDILFGNYGYNNADTASTSGKVICVRGNSYNVASRYTDESGNTLSSGSTQVKDQQTGLIWQRSQAPSTYTYSQAGSYCSSLTLGGQSWRLPTVKELTTLVDYSTYGPSINTVAFPGVSANWFWSSTFVAGSPSLAWIVVFYFGFMYGNVISLNFFVRCVR